MKLLLFLALLQVTLKENFGKHNILENFKDENYLGSLIYDVLMIIKSTCVVIICDVSHHKEFDHILFNHRKMYISYFMIIVESTANFSSSTEDIQLILEAVNNAGCQVYVIALANGEQASQLLVFGEKYRLLNTRGKFVILHNYQLFHKDLHYLWQRIINVIFIREYKGHQKKNHKKKPVPWFELSTVQYPFPIVSVMIPKRVDIWRQSTFRTGAELFKDKTSDLKNQTLQVVTFAHIPAILKVRLPEHDTTATVMTTKSNGFAGIEIEILQTLSKAINFVPNLYESENADIELWGKKLPDGEYTGLIGEMMNNNADIALGDLHYMRYFLKIMDLSIPYNTECLTFLTPESLTNNSWKTLVLPFTALLWVTILMSMVLIAFLFRALCKFHCNVNKVIFKDLKTRKLALKLEIEKTEVSKIGERLSPNTTYCLMTKKYKLPKIEGEPNGLHLFNSTGNSLLYTYGMLLVISLPKLPTGWSIRMLTGWYSLYCILIVVAYKASMTAILANPAPRVTIDTLQELVNSELECGGSAEINLDFFRASMDHASQVIAAKFQVINDTDEAINKIAKGSFALYENEYFLKQASVKKQLRYTMPEMSLNESFEIHKIPKGDHNLHIMSDCLIHMPISIGLQKNSPIKTKVDKLIRRVLEAGLIKKWLNDVMQSTNNDEIYFDDSDSIKAVMNMQKFFSAIVALFIGYAISFTALIFEILHFRLVVRKHPNYNKYTKQIVN